MNTRTGNTVDLKGVSEMEKMLNILTFDSQNPERNSERKKALIAKIDFYLDAEG